MNMFSNPEDEEFFNPTSTSTLASLFGASVTPKQETNASLIYTAPKQPKISGQETPKTTPKSTPQSTVICSKFVDVFQLLDKNHTPQGKCGLAIIGNQSVKTYEVILYKSKQEIITRSKLNLDFTFTVQSNNFCYFCDDRKQEWSVHFENAKELEDFIEKVKIYNGKIVYNYRNVDECQNKNPKPEETNLKLSATTTSAKDRDSDSTSDNSTNQTKANILTRMAKMGQSILPVTIPYKSSEHSDSETDEQTVNRKLVKKRQKVISFNGDYTPPEKANILTNQTLSMKTAPVQEYVMINGQLVLTSSIQTNIPPSYVNTLQGQFVQNIPNQMMMSQPQVSPMSDSLHIFIAENRTHNCEMRMNISQLSTKLDQVLSNINKTGQATSSETTPAINELEFLEKVKELEESKKLIGNLKEQLTKLREISTDNNESMNDLSRQNQELNKVILEQQNTIQELQKEKRILEEQNAHNNSAQQDLDEAQKTINDLRQTIDNQQSNINKLQEENKRDQNSEISISQLNERIASLQSQLSNKKLKADLFARKLKQSMNSLFQQIMENFENETISFESTQIKQIVSQKLKSATLTIIQEFQNEFDHHETTQNSQVAPLVPQFD